MKRGLSSCEKKKEKIFAIAYWPFWGRGRREGWGVREKREKVVVVEL